MLTQSIITAKHAQINSIIRPPTAIGDCIAHILNSMDHKKYKKTIESAITYPHRKYTFVLLEYIHSGTNDRIAQVERLPDTTTYIHDILKDGRVISRLNDLFIVNPNMRIHNRRKIDFSKPFGPEQLTKTRQLVLTIDEYAFARRRAMSEDSYADMPDLVAYHE
jgi:hypothetical protein